jgi:hypothetical protein
MKKSQHLNNFNIMKKSQLRQIIREEISKVLKENTTRTTDEETIKQYVDNDVAGSYVFFEGEPLFYTPDITDPELKNYREDGYEHFDIDETGRTVNVRIF